MSNPNNDDDACSPQLPDSRPGFYYVTVRRDAPRTEYRLLRGPFVNDHAAALAAVDETMRRAMSYDPKACWYAYGTCRSDVDLGLGLFDRLDSHQSTTSTQREPGTRGVPITS